MAGKRVLILSETFGMGHTMVARAIKTQIEHDDPEAIVNIVETTSFLRPTLSRALSSAYLLTIQHSPLIWSYLYKVSRRKTVNPQLWSLVYGLAYSSLACLLKDTMPDEIICTHPLPSSLISVLKKASVTNAILTTTITDYGLHGAWVSPEVDQYILPSHHLAQQMASLGIPEHKLVVKGLPIHPKFRVKRERSDARKKLGLADIPTVLCMGGGMGFGLPDDLIQALSDCLADNSSGGYIQVLFVAGKNAVLHRKITNNPICNHPSFQLYGFVNNIDELMDAADIIVTKPGGVTCAEIIAKGLPALLTKPLPGQEEDNLRYMVENGHGVFLEDMNSLISYIRALERQTIGCENTLCPPSIAT